MAASDEGNKVEVNNYRVGKRISHGSGSSIYAAHNTSLDRPAFLEVLHQDINEAPDLTSEFQERLEVVAQLKHDSIATIHVTGITVQNQRYAAIEYVPGSTLAELPNNLTVVEALQLIRQLADALTVAHAVDIFHHDLRPENILVRDDGRPVLIDLGLPIMATSPRAEPAGDAADGLDYAAPEQAQGQAPSAQSNIYSLGVILYELLAGHRPRPGQRMEHQETGSLGPEYSLEVDRPGLSAVTYRLVRNCLRREAGERFFTMAEMVAAIDVALMAEDTARRPLGGQQSSGSLIPYVAAGGLLLLLTIAGFLFASRQDNTPPQIQTTPLEAGTFLTLQSKGTIELLGPAPGSEFTPGNTVAFSWFWPTPLAADEVFTVHLLADDNAFLLGTVTRPTTGARYRLQVRTNEIAEEPGEYRWQVILEDSTSGESLFASEVQTFRLLAAVLIPTAEPTSTPTPTDTSTPTATATVTDTATATVTPTPTITPTSTPSCVPSQPPGWAPYTIRLGDFLSPLSVLTGTTVERIMAVNCLETVSLSIGQVVWLPGGGPTKTPVPVVSPTATAGSGGGGPKPTRRPPTPTPPS